MLQAKDILYGWSIKDIARICEVDLTTARRWKRGARCPPQSALMLLSTDLGHIDPLWAGWHLRRGELVTPNGFCLSRGDALSVELLQAQLSAWRNETLDLRRQIEAMTLEEQPLPVGPEAPAVLLK